MSRIQKTEAEQAEFFNACLQQFHVASGAAGEIKMYFNIAGVVVCLNFAGDALIPYLTPAIRHLAVGPTERPDAVIHVWDSFSTSVDMPPPPCTRADFTDRGDIWGFTSQRIKTAFHWSEFSVNVMDIESCTGIYWVKNPKAFPYWVYSSPFRTQFHWLMQKSGCQLIHAAAVGTENGAVLIPGKGGSGKSTTALRCLDSGLYYLGDDYVVVKKGLVPMVFSLYCTAKIYTEELSGFPSLQPLAQEIAGKNQEKAVLFIHPGLESRIKKEMPLKAILTPEIIHKHDTAISPVSFWPVLRAMSFTTMSQLPGVGAHTHDYLKELITQLPCYTIGLGSEPAKITDVISELLANPKKYPDHMMPSEAGKPLPLVSVIIPVHNCERYIAEAVESVLGQNYPAIELIIVDDGSTDGTKKVVDHIRYDVRYFYQNNEGPAAARNRGIRDVSGDFIAFVDADDLWPEDNLQLLMAEFEKDPDLDVVRGYAQLFRNREDGQVEYLGNPKEAFADYIGAALYRRSAFQRVGQFDPALKFGEDADWYNRARELKLKVKRLEIVTLLVRRHGGNMTEGKTMLELNALKVFKKALDRMRTTPDE